MMLVCGRIRLVRSSAVIIKAGPTRERRHDVATQDGVSDLAAYGGGGAHPRNADLKKRVDVTRYKWMRFSCIIMHQM